MYKEFQLSLYHDGNSWITDSLNNRLYEEDLNILEEKIIEAIKNEIQISNQDSVKVTLLFDMDCIPRWLHQYQSHYFNYSFTVSRQRPC